MTREEISDFLGSFHQKMRVFGVAFMQRDKNLQALADLDITPLQRQRYLEELTVSDYVSGPNTDTYDHDMPPYYEFGKMVRGREVYIKISRGRTDGQVLCMSFHLAEYPINYPLK